MERACTKCGEVKPPEDYYVKVKSTGRRFTHCKSCVIRRSRAWALANPEAAAESSRRYHRRGTEYARERKRIMESLRQPRRSPQQESPPCSTSSSTRPSA